MVSSNSGQPGRLDMLRHLFAEGSFSEAEQQIQAEIMPLLMLAADGYLQRGRLKDAYKYVQAMITWYPNQPAGYERAIRLLMASRQFDDVLPICEAALDRCSSDPGFCASVIQSLIALGSYEVALQASLRQTELHVHSLDGYLLAARCCVALERFDQARLVLAQAKDVLPGSAGLLDVQMGYLGSTAVAYGQRSTHPIYDLWRCSYQFKAHEIASPVAFQRAASNLVPIQYWSQPDPPADVSALTAQWNVVLKAVGLPEIQLFNKQKAAEWIASNAPQFLAAFHSAPHYSSESDVFRIAYATQYDTMYIDSDMYPARYAHATLSLLLSECSSGLYLYRQTPYLQGAFFVARRGCPFFAAIAERLAGFDYGSERLSRYSMFEIIHDHSFGPGIFNLVLRDLCERERPQRLWSPRFPLVQVLQFSDFRLQFCTDDSVGMSKPGLSYKGSDCSWQVWSRRQRK